MLELGGRLREKDGTLEEVISPIFLWMCENEK